MPQKAKERTGRQERGQRQLKKSIRSTDPKRLEAIERARKEREALERRIARESQQPLLGPVPGALYAAEKAIPDPEPEPTSAPPPVVVARDALGHNGWTRKDARSMLRQGYNIRRVVELTGVGVDHLVDMKLDEDGYGIPLEDW